MKTQEILLASAVLAIVAGVGASLATRAFQEPAPRAEPLARAASTAEPEAEARAIPTELARALDELRLENASLRERLGALEARLGELASTRTPAVEEVGKAPFQLEPYGADAGAADPGVVVDDAFVTSVGRALDEIEAREEAERELQRKERQAERIEQRVAELQTELGLSNRQASDLRTVLIGADDARQELFDELRQSEADPRDLRESLRSLRDETHTSLQGILTPEQFETFRQRDEAESRRDFGAPGGRPPEARREDRPRR